MNRPRTVMVAVATIFAAAACTVETGRNISADQTVSTVGVPASALPTGGDPVVVAAGDIACDPDSHSYHGGAGSRSSCRQRSPSDLVLALAPTAVLMLGDAQYYCGSLAAFQQVYDPTWGRFKQLTYPAVGNHEYLTHGGTGCDSSNAGAAGYFTYFGAAAGRRTQGWYSFDLGSWHLVALNSTCSAAGGCHARSAQAKWLAADLASHRNACTLAFWHIPVYSSGGRASVNMRYLWSVLYSAGADVVLAGHDHIYERFAPQRSDGVRDDRFGLREFVVGTGGANHTSLVTVAKNSERADATTYGVLRLTLHPTSYDWQFVPERPDGFTDSGSQTCHGRPAKS